MSITIYLQPEVERGLLAQAKAKGVSLTEYVAEIVAKQARHSVEEMPVRTGQLLIDVCAQVQGVLTDEEVDTIFARNGSMGRPVEL